MQNENAKKQILLRISSKLYDKVAKMAEDEFRSINSEIEYIISQAVKKHYNEKE